MSWFKKSIAYDQRRKLLVFPILIILLSVLNVITIREQILSSKAFGSLILINSDNLYALMLLLVVLIALVSFGFREVSERNYISSMPMKRRDIVLTKYSCAILFSIFPLILGFIMESALYVLNKEYLYQEGYFYNNVITKNTSIILVSMIIVSVIFFIGHLYSNIKVAAVLSILGGISFIHILFNIRDIFDINGPVVQTIDNVGNFIFDVIFYSISIKYIYTQSTLGIMIFLAGFVMLLYFLIDYISSRFTNDVYSSLHPFKISKVITLTILTMAMASLAILISGIAGEIFYIQPMFRSTSEGGAIPEEISPFDLVNKVQLVIAGVLLPLWIFLSRKINKKLEERF